MNKKTQEAPNLDDHEEETSFQGKFMYIKVFLFTSIFVYGCYWLNVAMLHKLKKRYARREGKLDEFLQQEELEKSKSFTRRWFGKVGGGEEDGLDGGIKHTTIGGAWELKTLEGKRFGSA